MEGSSYLVLRGISTKRLISRRAYRLVIRFHVCIIIAFSILVSTTKRGGFMAARRKKRQARKDPARAGYQEQSYLCPLRIF